MDLTTKGKIYLLISLISFFFAYLTTTLGFFPYLGISITLIVFAVLSYHFKKAKTSSDKTYLKFTLLFATLIFVRSAPFITFLNLIFSLFFGTLMLISSKNENPKFLNYLFAPILFIFNSLFTKSEYFLETISKKSLNHNKKLIDTIFGLVVSTLVLFITLPILSSTNPIFQKIVTSTLEFLSLQNLLENISHETLIILVWRLFFFIIFIIVIPKVLTLVKKETNISFPISINLNTFSFLLPKFVLAIVLSLFFYTQFQLYFADSETLTNLGVSHSQRSREVFGQLSVVAGIVMLILYNSRRNLTIDKVINIFLTIQGLFLTSMAFKSALEYINAWGFTYLRLYGVTIAAWITGIFLLYFWEFHLQKAKTNFVNKVVFFSGLVLLIVNVANFDYLIYHYKKSVTGQGVDYAYLSRLSSDSLSYGDQFRKLEGETLKIKDTNSEYQNNSPFTIIFNIEYLQEKYSEFDIRTLSLLEYIQYKKIENIDTKELRTYYENYLDANVDL